MQNSTLQLRSLARYYIYIHIHIYILRLLRSYYVATGSRVFAQVLGQSGLAWKTFYSLLTLTLVLDRSAFPLAGLNLMSEWGFRRFHHAGATTTTNTTHAHRHHARRLASNSNCAVRLAPNTTIVWIHQTKPFGSVSVACHVS